MHSALRLLLLTGGAFLFTSRPTCADVPHKSCFLMEEGVKDMMFVPIPRMYNGAHTWHGVDSETGDYVGGHMLFWNVGVWNMGHLTLNTGDRMAAINPPPGGSFQGSKETCIPDRSLVLTWPGPAHRGDMYRLNAPYYTTCAPRRGRPWVGDPTNSFTISESANSLRDCIAAAATEWLHNEIKTVSFDKKSKICTGTVKESGTSWDDSAPDTLSCRFSCLPLRGTPLFNGANAAKQAVGSGVDTLEQCDANGDVASPRAQGTHLTRGKACSVMEFMNGASLVSHTEPATAGDWFCFSPRSFNFDTTTSTTTSTTTRTTTVTTTRTTTTSTTTTTTSTATTTTTTTVTSTMTSTVTTTVTSTVTTTQTTTITTTTTTTTSTTTTLTTTATTTITTTTTFTTTTTATTTITTTTTTTATTTTTTTKTIISTFTAAPATAISTTTVATAAPATIPNTTTPQATDPSTIVEEVGGGLVIGAAVGGAALLFATAGVGGYYLMSGVQGALEAEFADEGFLDEVGEQNDDLEGILEA